jgi:hypothetical protein
MAAQVISQSLQAVIKTLSSQYDDLDTVAMNMSATGKSLAKRKELLDKADFDSELGEINQSLYVTVESMVKLNVIITGVKALNNEVKNKDISADQM